MTTTTTPGVPLPTLLATDAATAQRPAGPCDVSATRRITGLDGKSYRATRLTTAERAQAIRMAHIICHQHSQSIRAARQIMARYGVFRSTGTIGADLANYSCPHCDDQ